MIPINESTMSAEPTAHHMVIVVSPEMMAKMRELARDNEEVSRYSDEQLVKWVQSSIQSDCDRGNYIEDQFEY